VDQQLLGESAGGDSLPNVPLPDVPLPDVPFPDVPVSDVPHPEARMEGPSKRGVNQSSRCIGCDGCSVRVRVGFLSRSFPLF